MENGVPPQNQQAEKQGQPAAIKEHLQCRQVSLLSIFKSLSRMYENKYPEVDDLVMVKVRQIAEMGAYVHLMEYNNIEGTNYASFSSLNNSKE